MNRLLQQSAQVPTALKVLLVSPMMGLAGYWCFTYSGLYRVLAEWQLHRFGNYYPQYTAAMVVLACLIPDAVAIHVIGRRRAAESRPADAAARVARDLQRTARNTRWIQGHWWRLLGAIVTLGLAGVGAFFTGIGLFAGDRVSVDAGAIERGGRPGGRWAEITGRLVVEDAVSVSERDSVIDVYFPLASPEWRPGLPVRLYLKTNDSRLRFHPDELASGRYEGMLASNALVGVAITAFAERGQPAPEQYWVLEYGETPKSQLTFGTIMFVTAAIIGLLTAIGWAVARRRGR
ncbi:MAG TPA: hypothetical protein VIF57_06455 [Polyangia bacterium]|jgi:hypothetical protein